MARHPLSLDWRSASRIRRACLVVIVAILTLGLSAAAFAQLEAMHGPIKGATLDVVIVGSDTPSGRLTGFGPPEPETHPGSWGGAPPGSEFYRVLWFQGDESFGIVELRIPPHSVAQKVEIDYLNGASGCFLGSPSGDSFDVYRGRQSEFCVVVPRNGRLGFVCVQGWGFGARRRVLPQRSRGGPWWRPQG